MARFEKGKSGNPAGKAKGALDWRGRLRKQLEDAGPEIITKIVDAAKEGDLQAAKMILDRLVPAVKSQAAPVTLSIPNTDEAGKALAIFEAITKGEVPPDTGNELLTAMAALLKVREFTELIARIEALEKGGTQ